MREIHKVAILGAGTMGARIAAHLANASIPSVLLDIVPEGAGPGDPKSRNRIARAGLDAALKSLPRKKGRADGPLPICGPGPSPQVTVEHVLTCCSP